MSRKTKPWLTLLLLILILDSLIWVATIRVANAPSNEELQQQKGATPTLSPSIVNAELVSQPETVSLNGQWHYRQSGSEIPPFLTPELDISQWDQMYLPQNWYLAGLNYHGVIWFGREITTRRSWRGRSIQLYFAGIDYRTDVWLNGHYLGHHEGSFQTFHFPIHNQLNYSGQNQLLVRVESPFEDPTSTWPEQKQLIRGVFGHHPTRPGAETKADGQAYNTGGIWDDIYLTVGNTMTIDAVQVQATWPVPSQFPNNALLLTTIETTHHADKSQEITAQIILKPHNFGGPSISLPEKSQWLSRGTSIITVTGTISSPKLWWTWDRGKANLYSAHIILKADSDIIAHRELLFGFRLFEVDTDEVWYLNQMPIFARGTHYISNQWLATSDRAWLAGDLALLRDTHFNTIRVHAHVEPPEFYDPADERGFLVWQDFPLYGGYTDNPAFSEQAESQLKTMVKQLYNHPAIVVWNVHTQSPWRAIKGSDTSAQNKRLDERLATLVKNLDPSRHISQPMAFEYVTDSPVWNTGHWTDTATAKAVPLVAAYGTQALPNKPMMRQLIPEAPTTYKNSNYRARWRFHGFQPSQTFDIAQIDEGESLDTFIANSQAYQANFLQAATEAQRRKKYRPTTGLFQFMFVDHWPAISQAVLDYDRQPKAGYRALQTAMQPILPSIAASPPDRLEDRTWVYTDPGTISFQLWTVNDTLAAYPEALLSWQIESERGVVVEDDRHITVQADQVQLWVTLQNLPLTPGRYQLSLQLLTQDRHMLGENQRFFMLD